MNFKHQSKSALSFCETQREIINPGYLFRTCLNFGRMINKMNDYNDTPPPRPTERNTVVRAGCPPLKIEGELLYDILKSPLGEGI
jgi:hypothetical protein